MLLDSGEIVYDAINHNCVHHLPIHKNIITIQSTFNTYAVVIIIFITIIIVTNSFPKLYFVQHITVDTLLPFNRFIYVLKKYYIDY